MCMCVSVFGFFHFENFDLDFFSPSVRDIGVSDREERDFLVRGEAYKVGV